MDDIIRPSIKTYFALKLDDDYIADYIGDVTYVGPGCGDFNTNILLTKFITGIKLLFETYKEATDFAALLWARHNLIRIKNCKLDVVPICKYFADLEEIFGRKDVNENQEKS